MSIICNKSSLVAFFKVRDLEIVNHLRLAGFQYSNRKSSVLWNVHQSKPKKFSLYQLCPISIRQSYKVSNTYLLKAKRLFKRNVDELIRIVIKYQILNGRLKTLLWANAIFFTSQLLSTKRPPSKLVRCNRKINENLLMFELLISFRNLLIGSKSIESNCKWFLQEFYIYLNNNNDYLPNNKVN